MPYLRHRGAAAALFVGFLALGVGFARPALDAAAPFAALKPNRVLVVAGVQMRDPMVIRKAWDFGDIIGLLKLWGVPFDILRLDIHRMTAADFADASGRAKYGAILWTARREGDTPWLPQDFRVAAQAVARLHIGFIAFGNKIQEKSIQSILGIRYQDFFEFEDPVVARQAPHFLTRGLEATGAPADEAFGEGGAKVSVEASGTEVLASSGKWPQLTARTIDAATRTRAVWIGGDPDHVFHVSPFFIKVLRRALVWVRGYGFTKEYAKAAVLRMDDPGSSQSAYFKGWDYPQLDAAAIRDLVLAPLRARGAKLGIGFCPGYPWIPTRTIVPSVTIDFKDPRGVRQNIISEREGLLAGIKEGLLEVQSHGLTHMVPDLGTPPRGGKSWWDGSWTVEWPEEGWYREFEDERREAEIEPETQVRLLRTSASWIERDFGRRPLVFMPGGNIYSGDWFVEGEAVPAAKGGGKAGLTYTPPSVAGTNTYRLAAREGFGLALDEGAHYLGPDYVISLEACTGNNLEANFAREVPAVLYFHDRDLRRDPRFLSDLLAGLSRDVRFMSMDEWVAYLHSRLDVSAAGPGEMRLSTACDLPYGRYFEDHPSSWTLELEDDVLAPLLKLGRLFVSIDGGPPRPVDAATFFSGRMPVEFPAGRGAHTLAIARTDVR